MRWANRMSKHRILRCWTERMVAWSSLSYPITIQTHKLCFRSLKFELDAKLSQCNHVQKSSPLTKQLEWGIRQFLLFQIVVAYRRLCSVDMVWEKKLNGEGKCLRHTELLTNLKIKSTKIDWKVLRISILHPSSTGVLCVCTNKLAKRVSYRTNRLLDAH